MKISGGFSAALAPGIGLRVGRWRRAGSHDGDERGEKSGEQDQTEQPKAEPGGFGGRWRHGFRDGASVTLNLKPPGLAAFAYPFSRKMKASLAGGLGRGGCVLGIATAGW